MQPDLNMHRIPSKGEHLSSSQAMDDKCMFDTRNMENNHDAAVQRPSDCRDRSLIIF